MSFNPSIPQPTDDLSVSQGDILNNFASLDSTFFINHYGFSTGGTDIGKHKYVVMPSSSAPTTLATGEGAIFVNDVSSFAQLFWQPQNSATPVQLTAGDTTNANFASSINGWVFLPSGLVLQYGSATKTTDGIVTFPIAMTSVASVTCTVFQNSNSRAFVQVKTITTTQFTVASRDSGGSDIPNTFNWMAVGKL